MKSRKVGGTTIDLTVLNHFRYDGAWITGDERNTFDGSNYYDMMIDNQYTFRSRSLSEETGDDARPLYSSTDSNGTQVGNFIVSDFAIVYDFTVDEGTEYVENIFSHSLRKTCNQRKLTQTNYLLFRFRF